MFEDSTFESNGRIHTRSRGWGLAAFAFNSSILAALIVIPLIYPEALPKQFASMLLTLPPPPPAAPRPVEQQPRQVFHGTREFTPLGLTVPRQIPNGISQITGPERLPGDDRMMTMDTGSDIPGGDPFHGAGARPATVVHAEPRGPQHISSGVAEGMVIRRVIPQYSPIARAMGAQGTVVLQAVISKTGTIENLRAISGPQVLQQSAIDAVKNWLYRPYLLDGQPVEVETTINVIFSMNR